MPPYIKIQERNINIYQSGGCYKVIGTHGNIAERWTFPELGGLSKLHE